MSDAKHSVIIPPSPADGKTELLVSKLTSPKDHGGEHAGFMATFHPLKEETDFSQSPLKISNPMVPDVRMIKASSKT